MNNLSWKWLAVLALAVVVAGCGDPGPRLYKAGGTVTYKNAPVADAFVTFTYEDGEFANGMTDKDGKYQLNYKGRPGGASLGKCKVTITKTDAPKAHSDSLPTNSSGPPKSSEEYQARQKAMKQFSTTTPAQSKSLIPTKYADPNTSGFAFEIKADEKLNDFPLELKD